MEHVCNAYCTETEHCDLVYTDERGTEGKIWQSYGFNLGARVIRVEEAKEAPPFAMIAENRRDAIQVGSRPPGAKAWLVWFQ